jgi:hypothetical protein
MFTKIFQRLKKSKLKSGNEAGRSMVEMLGVLAIIGILSIGGILTYRYAVTKYAANETVDELEKRYVTHVVQFTHGDLAAGMVLDANEFGPVTEMGYPAMAKLEGGDTKLFSITLLTVPMRVCKQILRDYAHIPYAIKVGAGETVYEDEDDLALCGTEDDASAKMIFIYTPYARGQGEGGDGGEESTDPVTEPNKCAVGEEWDPVLDRCRRECAQGETYDPGTNSCRSCASNEFMDDNYDCHACTVNTKVSPVTEAFAINSCNACTTAARQAILGMCVKKCGTNSYWNDDLTCYHCGTNGDFTTFTQDYSNESCLECVDYQRAPVNGTCWRCNILNNVPTPSAEDKEYCLTCPDHEVINDTCLKKCGDNNFRKDNLACQNCSLNGHVTAGVSEPFAKADCQACTDYQRAALNGGCYMCNSINGAPAPSAEDKRNCATCPDAEVFKDICVKKCAADMFRYDGAPASCTTCTLTDARVTSSAETKTSCMNCTTPRTVLGDTCYLCSNLSGVAVTAPEDRTNCLSCDNHLVIEDKCYKQCGSNAFLSKVALGAACASCNADSVPETPTQEYRDECASCAGGLYPRAIINDKCYKCASLSGVAVETPADQTACRSCGEYTVVENKCYKRCGSNAFLSKVALGAACASCNADSVPETPTQEYRDECNSCNSGLYPRAIVQDKCYKCANLTNVALVTSADEAACLSCPNREIIQKTCLQKCGVENYRAGNILTSCFACASTTTTAMVYPEQRASCLACSTNKRTIIADMCYLCSSLNNLAVTTPADEEACLRCPDHEVVSGKCMKK